MIPTHNTPETVYKPPFQIKHKTGWQAASDFSDLLKAKKWLDDFNTEMYTDKTLKVEDFFVLNREGVRVL